MIVALLFHVKNMIYHINEGGNSAWLPAFFQHKQIFHNKIQNYGQTLHILSYYEFRKNSLCGANVSEFHQDHFR